MTDPTCCGQRIGDVVSPTKQKDRVRHSDKPAFDINRYLVVNKCESEEGVG